MKYHGSTMEFTEQRNAELLSAFRRHVRSVSKIVPLDSFTKVVESPASRFWVSEERAAIVIARMEAGKSLQKMRPNKLAMFREIYSRYLRLRSKRPDASLSALVEEVVHQPAPRFYLDARSAQQMFYRMRRQSCRKHSH